MKKLWLTLAWLFSALTLLPAQNSQVEMADRLRADGMIYVVVAVLVIIFLGLTIYLVNIDRKVSKLEKHNPNQPS
ncbi:MAG: CcmD family protein [Flavobacteriales bacterium]|nr:CcmD family protein [Flavobacteriales bacterium]MCB9448915.1 CcmD family protein [Flavobacteriales bacterium]